MNLQGKFAFLMATTMLLMAFTVISVPTEGVTATEWEAKRAHWNMKQGDALHLQTVEKEQAPTTVNVQADYDTFVPQTRSNRREVDAGTWELNEVFPSVVHMDGQVSFNLWYMDRDEGYSNEPEWRFILGYNGDTVAEVTVNGPDNADTPVEIYGNANLAESITLRAGDSFSLNIRYTGWEDADIYLDNFTYDSGFRVLQDSLWVRSVDASLDKVSGKFTDKAAIDWVTSGYCIRLLIYGEDYTEDPVLTKTGKKIDDGNGTQLEEWEVTWEGLLLNDTASVQVAFSFGDFDSAEEETWIGIPGESSGGGDDDDDDDFEIAGQDGYMMTGIIAAVAGGGAAGAFFIRKRRGGDDEDEFEDYDEEDEEEYEDDEEE